MPAEMCNVGGQAVLEGVMMRSPKAYTVVVRKPNGEMAVKEAPWRSITNKLKFLGWPFLRGVIVLLEALVNGIDALSFSANQALEEEEAEEADQPLGAWALTGTIVVSLCFGIALFVVLPHYVSLMIGRMGPVGFGVDSLAFHVIDGGIKLGVFLLYIWLIGFVKDIGRVFEYHGAEHKSIYTYEAGQELTVENARRFSTLHPRCGTAFLLVVLMISILFHAVVFPFIVPKGADPGWMMQIGFVLIKMLLLMPIAGLAYEMNRYASRHMDQFLPRLAIAPGLWVQRLTTREPSDDQIEVALMALQKALEIEESQKRT